MTYQKKVTYSNSFFFSQKQFVFNISKFHSDKVSYSKFQHILKEKKFCDLPTYFQQPWVRFGQTNILSSVAIFIQNNMNARIFRSKIICLFDFDTIKFDWENGVKL
jgi:hypothetical protein